MGHRCGLRVAPDVPAGRGGCCPGPYLEAPGSRAGGVGTLGTPQWAAPPAPRDPGSFLISAGSLPLGSNSPRLVLWAAAPGPAVGSPPVTNAHRRPGARGQQGGMGWAGTATCQLFRDGGPSWPPCCPQPPAGHGAWGELPQGPLNAPLQGEGGPGEEGGGRAWPPETAPGGSPRPGLRGGGGGGGPGLTAGGVAGGSEAGRAPGRAAGAARVAAAERQVTRSPDGGTAAGWRAPGARWSPSRPRGALRPSALGWASPTLERYGL